MKNSWVDAYYEALDFFFWEPQHLGRAAKPAKNLVGLKNVRTHLEKLEVTLNHQLNFFFSLAPAAVRNSLFLTASNTKQFEVSFILDDRDYDKTYGLKGKIQPDILFVAKQATMSVEIKTIASSSLDQVMKYVLLALAVELKNDSRMDHSLIYLVKDTSLRKWKKLQGNLEMLRSDPHEQVSKFLLKTPKLFKTKEDRFLEILLSISISFLDYEAFAEVLKREVEPLDSSRGSEVYRNLIHGLLNELRKRNLITRT